MQMSSAHALASFSRNICSRQQHWLLSLAFLASTTAAFADKFPLTVHEKQPTIVGRVTDSDMKPLESVQLKLSSPDSNIKGSAATKRDGSFEISHDPCKTCKLEVFPPKGSKLASAMLDNLSGETTRRLVIQLREGIHVTGRITGDGKGLKGLVLTFLPVDAKTSKQASVHGSGVTRTGKNGAFSLTITPGANSLVIDNDRYPDFKQHFDTRVTVTEAGDIPDISLPAQKH